MYSNKRGFIRKVRDSRTFKGTVVFVILNFIAQLVQPTVSLALTEGPSQPEVQSFEPIGTNQMVDLFTGDFNYNIPLFNLPGPNGGYPVNLAYHAGATMDDEASWVGLGWNINVGSLNRMMRGLPDEFMSKEDPNNADNADDNFDNLEVKSDIKQSWTLGVSASPSAEFFGVNLSENINLSASVYYNNYNGIGLSLDAGYSVSNSFGSATLGISADSENGLGVSASLSISDKVENGYNAYNLGISFDGKLGIESSISSEKITTVKRGDGSTKDGGNSSYTRNDNYAGSGISFARNPFSPSISHKLNNYSISLSIQTGQSGFGFATSFSRLGLFYNTQDIHDEDIEGRFHKIIGYDRVGETNDASYTRDFVRTNDGQITKSNQFLASSAYTYDVYNSTGQGLSGYFRPRRADVGRSFDPKLTNYSYGASGAIQFDNGIGTTLGFDIGASFGTSSVGPWDDNNELSLDFQDPGTNGYSENLYYQAHGEMSILDPNELAHIRGLGLPFIRLKNKANDGLPPGVRLVDQVSSPNNEYHDSRQTSKRVIRNTLIHNLKNNEVGKLGEFKIQFFTNLNYWSASTPTNIKPTVALNRSQRDIVSIEDHPAGYKVLNNEGSYYVYALPAYNIKEVENLFSVPVPGQPEKKHKISYDTEDGEVDYKVGGTDKFIRKTTKSPYAHSYLLTSVQGADYVDIGNDGPTDDDLGYWVKFNYLRNNQAYKWRSPYTGAFYSRGATYTNDDDKGSYSYGEKELWYTAQIETKTHIAVFCMENRVDNKEAYDEHESGITEEEGLRLSKIQIFEKKNYQADPANAVPLQEVHFEHSYELCKGTDNSRAPGGNGKLTLTKLWFTSNGSTRGDLSKYEFNYGTTEFSNPNFNADAYDSWGTHKPVHPDFYEHHSNFPYVNQFNQDWDNNTTWEPTYANDLQDASAKATTKETQADLAGAWCLKQIKLPSGGTINIEYESDDYGYVQHKTACQMFKIESLGYTLAPHKIYDQDLFPSIFQDENSTADEVRRRIYFKLEEPIDDGTSNLEVAKKIYHDYVEPMIKDENGQRNLYFKTKMALTENNSEYVSGYLPIEESLTADATTYNFGADQSDNDLYTRGFITIKASKKKNGNYFDQYHPLALLGWTYLQTNAPKLLNNPNSLSEQPLGEEDLPGKVVDLLNIIPATANSFGAIRPYCHGKKLASSIDLNHSVIRLASPDKIKYGGGHRVKQISISDNWNADTDGSETSRTYGQTYEYTINEDGYENPISSGVAQYEPQAGGDENALKYPFYYFDKQNAFTNNNLFTEAPLNENLYPGASVGYRKVTVKSINTNLQMRNAQLGGDPAVGRTGGISVHEFYTAKEFPTITEHSMLAEENDTKQHFFMPIPIPFVGSITRHFYHGTQAYLIELNDMHGKPKSVKTFELNNYEQNLSPITSAIYEYQQTASSYQGENIFKLNNEVSIIPNDGSHQLASQKRLMGIEYDLFTDQRESKTFHNDVSLNFNLDVASNPLPVGVPSFWMTYNNSKSMFRTYVMNKVIHRSGILKKTITRDLQASNESEIVAYDEKSGQPLLTKMKNEFGDDFYSYNIPAYYHYDRMGHASENINYSFVASTLQEQEHAHGNQLFYFEPTQDQLNHLFRGDELLLLSGNTIEQTDRFKKAYFIGWKYIGNTVHALVHVPEGLSGESHPDVIFKVIRSGLRNHHSAMAANYLTKGDPLSLLSDITLTDPGQVDLTTQTKQFNPNTVLSATASIYNDNWANFYETSAASFNPGIQNEGTGLSDENQGGAINRIINPFLRGVSGIFRPQKSYTYVGPRKTSANLSNTASNPDVDPKLFDDGVFTANVPMFTWNLGNIEDIVPQWEWVNEVTRYSSDSYETENVNRLDIYSSALYGYDNSLSIGVGGNADYYEMGVDDFETAPSMTDLLTSWANNARMEQNNLNFYQVQDQSKTITSEQINFKYAKYNNGLLNVKLNNPSDYLVSLLTNAINDEGNEYLNTTFGISLTSNQGVETGNKGFYLNGIVTRVLTGEDGNSVTIKPFYHCANENEFVLKNGSIYRGKLTVFEKRDTKVQQLNNVAISAIKAHTGKRSMSIDGAATFDQPKLKCKRDKKYIWSMWVSRDNTNVPTYKPDNNSNLVVPGIMDNGNFGGLTNYTIQYGKIVEGWQKIDIEFQIDAEQGDYSYKLIALKFNTGSSKLYVDDIRFSPKTGGMVTYVYDPFKFWLRANLNVDNYATLFFYDEEGNLTLKKQETEKGIFTITESRGHVSED